MRPILRTLLAFGISASVLMAGSSPASAATYPVAADLEFGRRDIQTVFFGTINVDTPDSGVGECEGSRTLTGEFDDVTNEVRDLTITIKDPVTLPVFGGTYQLEATGSNRTDGTWNPSTGEFSGAREEFTFQIQAFNETGCVKGDVLCEGNLDIEFSGTTLFGTEGPTPGTTGPVWLQATTERRIAVDEGCESPWSFLLPDADLRLEANPNPGGNPGAPGAEYR